MADIEKVLNGLQHCIEKLDSVVGNTHGFDCTSCSYFSKCESIGHLLGLPLMRDALALLKAYKRRHALEVHNISGVDIPDGVTEKQFYAVMSNVVEALEHTDRGESWPYDDGEGLNND